MNIFFVVNDRALNKDWKYLSVGVSVCASCEFVITPPLVFVLGLSIYLMVGMEL